MIHKLFTGPFDILLKVGEKIQDELGRELYDIDHIQRQLVQLQLLFEMDEISQENYKQQEEELLKRYEIAKQLEQGAWKA